MITIITRWDSTQMPTEVEWQIWRQMKSPLEIDKIIYVPIVTGMDGFNVEQYATMEDALASVEGKGELVFLESTAIKTVAEIPAGDIVMILGNTGENNLAHSTEDQRYKIETKQGHLYGFNAAAIALVMKVG